MKKAVALKYRECDSAPTITAKGRGRLAELIVKIAGENNIHIEENALLSETLFQFEVGDYIPEEAYEIIARLLAFVYTLKLE